MYFLKLECREANYLFPALTFFTCGPVALIAFNRVQTKIYYHIFSRLGQLTRLLSAIEQASCIDSEYNMPGYAVCNHYSEHREHIRDEHLSVHVEWSLSSTCYTGFVSTRLIRVHISPYRAFPARASRSVIQASGEESLYRLLLMN